MAADGGERLERIRDDRRRGWRQKVWDEWIRFVSRWIRDERLVLRVRRHDRTRVLRPYLQHIESVADEMELRHRELQLYANTGALAPRWASTPFIHPAMLDTVAMDPELKTRIRSDLEGFLKGRAYYHRLGCWRRGYLLYSAQESPCSPQRWLLCLVARGAAPSGSRAVGEPMPEEESVLCPRRVGQSKPEGGIAVRRCCCCSVSHLVDVEAMQSSSMPLGDGPSIGEGEEEVVAARRCPFLFVFFDLYFLRLMNIQEKKRPTVRLMIDCKKIR